MKRSVLALVLLSLASLSAIPTRAEPVPVETIDVGPGLHLLMGRGGNVAVSTGSDGPVLVDDQYADMVPGITAAVAALQPGPIRFVINTHYHGDHTGGNDALGRAGALIVAHENVRERMRKPHVVPALGIEDAARAAVSLPVVTFADGVDLHWNGAEIHVEHVAPAHTDGDAIVWFPQAGAVHMGDTFFNGIYPFIDVFAGGSIAGMIAAADIVLRRAPDDTKIIPGHGPLAAKPELRAFREMLVTVRDRVSAAQAAGESREAFVARKPLSDLDPVWGGGFLDADRFLGLVWLDLARPAAGSPDGAR